MALDVRLKTVYELFPACRLAADIGADHGKLALEMILRKKAERIIVTDISRDSLNKAKSLFEAHHLSEYADFVEGDGLTVLPSVPDAVSICGMGGKTIAGILERGLGRIFGAGLVLSPQTEIFLVRRTLCALGYRIKQERCVRVSGRFYVIMYAEPGDETLSGEQCELGPRLSEQTDSETVRSYYLWRFGVLSAERNGMSGIRAAWYRAALQKKDP